MGVCLISRQLSIRFSKSFSPENWDPCANFEYTRIYKMRFWDGSIQFILPHSDLKTSKLTPSYLTYPNWPQSSPDSSKVALRGHSSPLLTDFKLIFLSWIFLEICGSFRFNNCQAQPQPKFQLSRAKIALLSLLWGTYTLHPPRIVVLAKSTASKSVAICSWLAHGLFPTF